MVEKEIIRKINKLVEKVESLGVRVEKAILYGSRASGKAREDSDIDVAIVSSDFGQNRFEEGTRLFEVACDIDPRMEPVPLSLESYENDTWIPLVYEIRKNGVEVKV